MAPSFDTPGDVMPGSIESHRTKYIHSVGAVGKVKFVPDATAPSSFTGIFKGANSGLIRLSSAAQPTTDGS